MMHRSFASLLFAVLPACALSGSDSVADTVASVTVTTAAPVTTSFDETGPGQVGQIQTVVITIKNTTGVETGQDIFNMHFPAAHFSSFVEPAGIAPCTKDKDRNTARGVVAGCVIPTIAPRTSLTFAIGVVPDFAGTLHHTTDLFSPLGGAQTDLAIVITPATATGGGQGGHGG
jgi:hypothetical protein